MLATEYFISSAFVNSKGKLMSPKREKATVPFPFWLLTLDEGKMSKFTVLLGKVWSSAPEM